MSVQNLKLLPGSLAVCRLPENADVSNLKPQGSFWSVIRSPGEITLVLPEKYVPDGCDAETGWTCLEVEGPLEFSLTGVLASLANPLAKEGISIYVISSFSTDYLLIKRGQADRACDVLEKEGHTIKDRESES